MEKIIKPFLFIVIMTIVLGISYSLASKKNINKCSKREGTVYRSSDSFCVCPGADPMGRNKENNCESSIELEKNKKKIQEENTANKNSIKDDTTLKKSIIQGIYFFDYNESKIFDKGDSGVDGTNISLYYCNDREKPILSAKSDYYGGYMIDKIEPGSYKIEFGKIKGFRYTYRDDSADSCFDVKKGSSKSINIGIIKS